MTTLSKPCAQCGKIFLKPKNCSLNTWKTRKKYCSKKCSMQSFIAKLRANPVRKGAHHTAAANEKNRLAHLGKIHSDKTRQKMSFSQSALKRTGEKAPGWRGGRLTDAGGYVWIYNPSHPFALKRNSKKDKVGKYVKEHRLVAEKILGRYLKKSEIIHHINGVKNDNRPENLYLFSSAQNHDSFEKSQKKPFLKSNLS